MSQVVELNQGEIKVKLTEAVKGKVSFKELGVQEDELFLENGLLRLVFNLDGVGEYKYFRVPTIEVEYKEEVGETHWQCDFNGVTVIDKTDHHGHSTVVLLDRKKLAELEHRHENTLVLHAEFPKAVTILINKCNVNLFK